MTRKLNPTFVFTLLLCALSVSSQSLHAQLSDTAAWSATVQNDYRVVSNITYMKANNMELRVDVYRPRNAEGPVPTFIYYHGGG